MSARRSRILLVEDDEDHASLITRVFEESVDDFELTWAASLAEARERLAEATPDLVIADLRLPDGAGTELLSAGGDQPFPVVMLTARGDQESAVAAMKAGALDYIVKTGRTLAELPHLAEHALREWGHIVERKRAEAELRASEERYRQLFGTVPDPTMVLDPETGRFLAVNEAATELYGYTREEFLAIDHSLITAEPGKSESSFRRTLASGVTRIPLRYHRRKDGTVFPVEISASSFEFGGRRVLCGVVRDISARQRARDALESSRRELQLLSRRMLSIREEEKKVLSSLLHHELGSLAVGLSAKLMLVEGHAREAGLPPAQEAVQEAKRILKDAVARLKQTAVNLRPPDLDVLGLAEALKEHFDTVTEQTGLEVSYEIEMGGGDVEEGAATTVYRIAQEALTNVVKHAEATEVDVTLRADTEHVYLAVRDNGKGFDARNSPAPGVRRRSADAEVRLGIRAMREMAEAAGGLFAVESTPGGGTVIRATVPIDPGTSDECREKT